MYGIAKTNKITKNRWAYGTAVSGVAIHLSSQLHELNPLEK